MQLPAWQRIAADLSEQCGTAGLDLVQPFAVQWYNDAVGVPYRLPTFDRHPCLGLLVGNTRALWDHFLAALRANPSRLDVRDPLDQFVEAQITTACFKPSSTIVASWGKSPKGRKKTGE